jgi:dTDP-4-dehydrorhamnose 3,5-epimerase
VRFELTDIDGVTVVEVEEFVDERGFFARSWCRDEFAKRGLATTFVQENVAGNPRRGTLRGMHFQRAPHAEAKLVRCTSGSVWDVALDLRPESPTRRQWVGVELSAENHRSLYVPEGCAHGYLTLTDDAEVRYLTSHAYVPDAAGGVRYDDPAFAIAWPADVLLVSERDASWPLVPSLDGTPTG